MRTYPQLTRAALFDRCKHPVLEYGLLRPVNSALGPKNRGFSRESGQNHRHHDYRYSQYSAFRPFFRLAERLMLRCTALLCLFVCLYVAFPQQS